jgi:branched-chain amino acid transport system permease protein
VAELIRTAITNSEPLGRATGLSVPTFAVQAEPSENLAAVYFTPWVYGVALLTILLVWRLQHSPKGRALQCLREDEIAAGAVGIDVTAHKVMAFVIGAGLAGMGGALFAHYIGYINPKQFDLTKSIELVVMVTLGGLGSIPGTIIAAVLLTLFQPALQTANSWLPGWAPDWARSGAEVLNRYRLVIYSLLLIVAMLVRSRGWLRLRRSRFGSTGGGN